MERQGKEIFLATTANEEFWDTSKPIVFLGEWCLRYSRKSFWEALQPTVITSPLSLPNKAEEAYAYVSRVYEYLLPCLGEVLNRIHNQKHSQRYWRIVIGNWLFGYISIIYDRYLLIRLAIERYPELSTILLEEDSFVTTRDTADFMNRVLDDAYNLQIFTRIIDKLLPNDFSRINLRIEAVRSRNYFLRKAKNLLKNLLKNNFARLGGKDAQIILKNSYFPRKAEEALVSKTRPQTAVNENGVFEAPFFTPDNQARGELKKIAGNGDEFIALLIGLIDLDMPQCFIEGYSGIHRRILSLPAPKAILSAISWYFDEAFKQWAALSAENGTMLIGSQHGGNYGSDAFMYAEEHELKITDRYYSWGWTRQGSPSQVVPFFATKLCGRIPIGADNTRHGILLITTVAPRYAFIIQVFLYYGVNNYLSWMAKFISSLSLVLREKLRVRLFHTDFGWDYLPRLNNEFPDINIESCGTNFLKSLHNCRICVCDHQGTTMLEALAANKPTILFWSQENNKIRPEARHYYDNLRLVGVLHDTPESAAAKLNSVYDDIEGWWNGLKLQSAVYEFSQRFCRTSTDALDNWEKELRRIAADGESLK